MSQGFASFNRRFWVPLIQVPDSSPQAFAQVWALSQRLEQVMNWSRSVVTLRWVRVSAPARCSPRGLRGVCDSFEGFSTLYHGTLFLLSAEVRLILFHRSQLIAGKPLSLCAREADQGFARLYRSTLTHPLGKEEGWEHRTTLDGRVPTISSELSAWNSSGSPCPVR
jgi:hypothetical protein